MTFKPGQSGNPSGRSKELVTIQALARKYAPQALKSLVHIATKGKSESARVTASEALLSRGFGKPMQALEHSVPDGAILAPLAMPVINVYGKPPDKGEK